MRADNPSFGRGQSRANYFIQRITEKRGRTPLNYQSYLPIQRGAFHLAHTPTMFAIFNRIFMIRSELDRKSTRLNSSHVAISYAAFCLKKKKTRKYPPAHT